MNNIKILYYPAILSLLTTGCVEKQVTERPNIIYILCDDLGYGDVSAYNHNGKIPTPGIDKLAAEGMKFTDAHTSSSVSTPTRYGILTGRYNWRSPLKSHVLYGNSNALIDTGRMTVASLLKNQGYHTAFIGKWHLGWNWSWNDSGEIMFDKPIKNGPNDLGFDYSYGFSGSLDMPPYVFVENGMATAIPDTITENTGMQYWRKGLTAPDFQHEKVLPDIINRAVTYIHQQSQSHQPYFLYLPLPSPHTPILPIGEWKGKSGMNEYADFVMMTDYYIGLVLDAIKESGESENTIVIFTSDNGCSPMADIKALEEMGHNPNFIYRGHKADIYEGGHRVPFIVKWPSVINAGSVCDSIICTTDFFATCADILNVKIPDNAGEDSYSMLPLFDNNPATIFERKTTVHHSIDGNFAIRKGDWKLCLCSGSGGWSYPEKKVTDTMDLPKYQLYNLFKDPSEKNNLYDSFPDITGELHQEMVDIFRNGRSTAGMKQENDKPMRDVWPGIEFLADTTYYK